MKSRTSVVSDMAGRVAVQRVSRDDYEPDGDHCKVCSLFIEWEWLERDGICIDCHKGPPPVERENRSCVCCGSLTEIDLCGRCEERVRKEGLTR